MAETEYITIDFIEVPSCPLHSNVVKLLEVEQRRKAIYEKKWDLELQALKVVSKLKQHSLFHFAWTGGISIYLTTKIPSAVAFAISILLMCLFLADSFICIGMAKSRITTMNMLIINLTQRYKDLREETRNLMEFERSKKGRLANVVDNSEGPVMDMDSFIARTKTIYDDATDFSDFEKAYHKMIMCLGGSEVSSFLLCCSCHFVTITTDKILRLLTSCLLLYEMFKFCISSSRSGSRSAFSIDERYKYFCGGSDL